MVFEEKIQYKTSNRAIAGRGTATAEEESAIRAVRGKGDSRGGGGPDWM